VREQRQHEYLSKLATDRNYMEALDAFKQEFETLPLAAFANAKQQFEAVATTYETRVRRRLNMNGDMYGAKLNSQLEVDAAQRKAGEALQKAQKELDVALGQHLFKGSVRGMLHSNSHTVSTFVNEMRNAQIKPEEGYSFTKMGVLEVLDSLATSDLWSRMAVPNDPKSARQLASYAAAVKEFVNGHFNAVTAKGQQLNQEALNRARRAQEEQLERARLEKLNTPSNMFLRGGKGFANFFLGRERNQGARHNQMK